MEDDDDDGAWRDNVEVFWHDGNRVADGDVWADDDDEPLPAGWYYWYCFPGCMPESDPNGPFDSEQAAWDDVRDNYSL